jgi:hypothetical protein
MHGLRASVDRVTDWRFAGVSYSVFVGRTGAIRGWMVLSALGTERGYRSVALAAHEAPQVLSTVLSSEDPAFRTDTAECLLDIRDVLLAPAEAGGAGRG